jgi:hypothetical protein
VGGGGEKIKFQKKKNIGKILGKGQGENKIANFFEIRPEKGQTKKINLGWHMDRKENPIGAPSIHVGALVGANSLWPKNVFKNK